MATSAREYVIIGRQTGEVRTNAVADPVAGQVLIRVIQNGLCASDRVDWVDPPEVPLALGHEPVGEVVAAGANAKVQVGDVITGRITPSFSDFALADEIDVVKVPEGLPPSAVLGEPLGCVVEGVRRSRLLPGQSVAVVGAGYMGLLLMQVLAVSGASSITAIDTRRDALDHALANGADQAALASSLPPGCEDAFDLVVEASGSQAGLDLSTRLVRSQGTLSMLGYHQGHRDVDMEQWNWKALDVVSAHVRDRRLLAEATAAGLALQLAGRIDSASLITHRFSLDEVDRGFATLSAKPDGYIKAVIEFS